MSAWWLSPAGRDPAPGRPIAVKASIRRTGDPREPVGAEHSLVLRLDPGQFGVNIAPQSLVQGGADQDLAAFRPGTVPIRPVGGFADDRQLHAVIGADEPVQRLSALASIA